MSEEEFYNKLKYNFFGTKDSEDFKELVKAYNDKSKKLELYKSITKEVREFINKQLILAKRLKLFPCDMYIEDMNILLFLLDKVEENK